MANGFKTGGRQKGTLNKQTLLNREKFQKIFNEGIDSGQLSQAIFMLPPAKFVSAMLKISTFLIPKADSYNTAEIIDEERPYRRNPLIVRVGSAEEAQNERAQHPAEAEFCQVLLENKTDEEAEAFAKRFTYIYSPILTREEAEWLEKKGMNEFMYAKLLVYNENNRDRWEQEWEVKRREANEEGLRIARGE